MEPEIETYSFSAALELIKLGKKMACLSWNGKNQWVTAQYPDECSKMQCPYLYLHNAQDNLIPWTPSQGDLFNDTWVEVKDNPDQCELQL